MLSRGSRLPFSVVNFAPLPPCRSLEVAGVNPHLGPAADLIRQPPVETTQRHESQLPAPEITSDDLPLQVGWLVGVWLIGWLVGGWSCFDATKTCSCAHAPTHPCTQGELRPRPCVNDGHVLSRARGCRADVPRPRGVGGLVQVSTYLVQSIPHPRPCVGQTLGH